MLDNHKLLRGKLHVFVAFDWGDEINLDRARRLLPAQTQELARRRRTPSSMNYRPVPLRYPLGMLEIELPEVGRVQSTGEAIVFDFGGVSVSVGVDFEQSAGCLLRLAGALSDPQPLVEAIRKAATPLFEKLRPAIKDCAWSPLGEEYFVFEIPPGDPLPPPAMLVDGNANWLAGLVRLEADPLSAEEMTAALASRISYSPSDMLIAAWPAGVLIDRDCEETLQTIEFANLQLLEYRYIDNLLDERMATAYSTIHRTLQSWLPLWRTHARPLRQLGELRIDAINLFERTGNALKLVGDQYLARVYQLIAARFHLAQWEQNIRSSLDVVEGAYQVVSDQSSAFRVELLEIIVVVLIAIEIVLAFVRH